MNVGPKYECPFCDIIETARPEFYRGMTNTSVTFTPLNPVTEGHVLVVPRRHVSDFAGSPELTGKVMQDAANYAATRHHECNIITSRGRAATQSVFHLHVHVVPRQENDGLHLPWTGQATAP